MAERLFDPGKFATELRVELAIRHLDMREASTQIGCSHATVSRVCNGKAPDVENYLRIERWKSLRTSDGGKDA